MGWKKSTAKLVTVFVCHSRGEVRPVIFVQGVLDISVFHICALGICMRCQNLCLQNLQILALTMKISQPQFGLTLMLWIFGICM